MNEQKHIVNRQVLEVKIPERGQTQTIQNKTSDIIKHKLHPALDKLFSKLSSADEIIRIDKLVIDLGMVAETELENVFVDRAVKQIGDEISKLKISASKNNGKTSVNGNDFEKAENIITTSQTKDLLEQFVYFLKTGRFPWWANVAGLSSKYLQEVFSKVLKYEERVLKSTLLPLFKNPVVNQRLVFQFDHSQIYTLFEKINYQLIKSYFISFSALLSLIKTSQKRKEITGDFYQIALQYFSIEKQLKTEKSKIAFIRDILTLYLAKFSDVEKEQILADIINSLQLRQSKKTSLEENLTLIAAIQVTLESTSYNNHLQKIIKKAISNNGLAFNKLAKQHFDKSDKDSIKKKEDIKEAATAGQLKKLSDSKIKNNDKSSSLFIPKPDADAEEIFISNAGLVLIHPFLRYFFEGLNLLDKELQFKSKSDAHKAIHLLQFIAAGQETTDELELPLNKILCGIDINEPVPKYAGLSNAEKEECIFLIKTVLERWEALKTSKPAALRNTYLQREGILKQSGSGWNLNIERNTFDVMLEKLPWSISLIKLPWLSQILYVEW